MQRPRHWVLAVDDFICELDTTGIICYHYPQSGTQRLIHLTKHIQLVFLHQGEV